ncbi:unnamed protein product [Orchesella dallaii]|uniref:Chromo domain-containing protein n=1 Tax=Orchesella dallaii TaxID=48710 RepID=A0ABP1Q5H2_9HEXA
MCIINDTQFSDAMGSRTPVSTATTDSEDEEQMFLVEKILKKRNGTDGKSIYLIKWEGYGDEENTWEPEENLPTHLISQFKEELKEKKMRKRMEANGRGRRSQSVSSEDTEVIDPDNDEGDGDEEDKIIDGFINEEGERVYVVKLKNVDEPVHIPVMEAHAKYPAAVIDFHQDRFHWNDANDTPNGRTGRTSCIVM